MFLKFFPTTKSQLNPPSIFSLIPGDCCTDQTFGDCCTDDKMRTQTPKTVWSNMRKTPFGWTGRNVFPSQRSGAGNYV